MAGVAGDGGGRRQEAARPGVDDVTAVGVVPVVVVAPPSAEPVVEVVRRFAVEVVERGGLGSRLVSSVQSSDVSTVVVVPGAVVVVVAPLPVVLVVAAVVVAVLDAVVVVVTVSENVRAAKAWGLEKLFWSTPT